MSRRYVEAQRKVVPSGDIACVPGEKVAILLYASLIVARQIVEKTARTDIAPAPSCCRDGGRPHWRTAQLPAAARCCAMQWPSLRTLRRSSDRARPPFERVASPLRFCCSTWLPVPARTSRTASREAVVRVSMAKRWAESDVSSPSASRTVAARPVATASTWFLSAATPSALVISSPVTGCVALTETV